jgi:hypothetical protein
MLFYDEVNTIFSAQKEILVKMNLNECQKSFDNPGFAS